MAAWTGIRILSSHADISHSSTVLTGVRYHQHVKIKFVFTTTAANLAIWLANLPLSIRVHATLLASMCHTMPLSARALSSSNVPTSICCPYVQQWFWKDFSMKKNFPATGTKTNIAFCSVLSWIGHPGREDVYLDKHIWEESLNVSRRNFAPCV